MAKVAALFPGQGSQAAGMGLDLADHWDEAEEVFELADRALGFSLSRLCWEGPEDRLRLTENTQPALLAHSIAAWRVLAAGGLRVEAVAGHSLGEYSALVAAGGIELEDGLRTVRLRGRLMQEAVPVGEGGMAAILGLDDDEVVAACAEEREATGEEVVAANFNSPAQVVIAGSVRGVEGACARCRTRGARRAVSLPVSAPFHSPLMEQAQEGLRPTLEELAVTDLSVPLIRNVDARAVTTAADIRDGLIRQIDSPVRWTDTIRALRADGFDTFVEVGAGSVLSGLVRRIDREARCHAAGTVVEIEQVLETLVS
jgi:[acyl-carrier-protein] S-malonyltransferase